MRKIIILIIIIALMPIGFADQIFFDLDNHWATPAIYWAVDRGYVNGYGDGTFRPEQGITRLEFLAIYQEILKTNDIFSSEAFETLLPYADLENEDWGKDVLTATEANLKRRGHSLLEVFPDVNFAGETPLSRQEAMLLVAWITPEQFPDPETEFLDLNDEQKMAMVDRAVAHGIFTGYPDGTIRLADGLTRAEATIVLQRLAVKLEIFRDAATAELLIPSNIYDNAYLPFGQYDGKTEKNGEGEWTDDGRYLRVMRTLEYLSFDQQIPFSEKKLYDESPVTTLVSLRTGEYWNRIGVDYYLLQAAPFSEEEKQMLAQEMFLNFMIRNDLSFTESKQLFQKYAPKISDRSLLENVFAYWNTQIASPEERFTLYSMQANEYTNRGYFIDARMGYEWMRNQLQGVEDREYWIFTDPKVQRMYLANLIFLDDQIGGRESVEILLKRMRTEAEELENPEPEKHTALSLVDELENRYRWEKIKVLP